MGKDLSLSMETTFEHIKHILPESVKIGGVEYGINLLDTTSFIGGSSGNEILDGEFDTCKGRIQLATKQKDNPEELIAYDRLITVLLHEILHGIFYHYLEDYTENEEHIVTQLAKGLYQVLKENPELTKLIGNNRKEAML